MELVTTLRRVVDELSTMIRLYSGETPVVLHADHPEVAGKVIRRICLQCGDEVSLNKAYRRGLCPRCYQATTRKIAARLTTEDKLIAAGLLTADKDPGGRRRERTALDDFIENQDVADTSEPSIKGDDLRTTTFTNSKAVVRHEKKARRKKATKKASRKPTKDQHHKRNGSEDLFQG